MQGVSIDDRRWLLALAWLTDNIALIQTDAQFDKYVNEACALKEKLTAQGLEPGMPEFAQSRDGRMAVALLSAIGEWQSRIEREGSGREGDNF